VVAQQPCGRSNVQHPFDQWSFRRMIVPIWRALKTYLLGMRIFFNPQVGPNLLRNDLLQLESAGHSWFATNPHWPVMV